MKKLLSVLLAMMMLVSVFTACGGGSDYPAELEEAGISQKDFEAMSDEQKQAILDELGIKGNVSGGKEETKPTEKPKKATLDDVRKGGKWVVTVGDSMLWNYVELHYEDGKLVKIYVSFQKNDDEPADIMTAEGDEIADFGLYFIDYTDDVSTVVNALIDNGFTNTYIEKAE